MMRKWLSSLIILLILIPSILVFGQDSPPLSLEITGANASELPTITITTNILDSSSLPVADLTADDFVIGGDLEGLATIVSVENITADDLPFASVLVIDTSTSMQGLPLRLAKEAATLFVQSVGDDDPIAIVTFDSAVRVEQDYTTDKDLLLEVIDDLFVRGRTALYDAAVLGAQVAADAPISRRAVVLLSDGAEFGGESRNGRGAGLVEAVENGVSMYTIGLGFGTDRSYLEELSSGTNARNFESPSPDELTAIYGELASLFRTQYVITAESDIPFDGTEYEFSLQAVTADGESNIDTGTIRAPIPIPIVALDDNLFAVPFSSPVEVTADVQADDEIADISITIDGETIDHENGTFTIDPVQYPPGSYELVITVTDAEGDSGNASATFETAALASEVTIDFADGTAISEPTTITLNADGQTPAVTAGYSILSDGVSVASETSMDAENGFPFTINPFDYAVGDYELFIGVENEGGATANTTVPFSIASVAPQNLSIEGVEADTNIEEPTTFSIAADAQSGANIVETSVTMNGELLDDLEIRPASLQPGTLELEVTATDSNGASITETLSVQVAPLPPQISFGDVPDPVTEDISIEVIIDSQTEIISANYNFGDDIDINLQARSDGTYAPIPVTIAFFQQDEVSIVVEATNSGGLTVTEILDLTIVMPPTATPIPDLTGTADAVIAIETGDAVATINVQSTLDAQATIDAVGTVDAQATLDAENEANAQATLDAEVTEATEQVDAEVTADAQVVTDEPTTEATEEDSSAVAANVEATEAATEAPEVEATATITETAEPTVVASLTPVEIVDVGAQSAEDTPVEGNLTGLLVAAGAILLVVILLGILWFGRGGGGADTRH